MAAMSPLKEDDPRMKAWQELRKTEEFTNAERWAKHTEVAHPHLEGSLWFMFIAGYDAAKRDCLSAVEGVMRVSPDALGESDRIPGQGYELGRHDGLRAAEIAIGDIEKPPGGVTETE